MRIDCSGITNQFFSIIMSIDFYVSHEAGYKHGFIWIEKDVLSDYR